MARRIVLTVSFSMILAAAFMLGSAVNLFTPGLGTARKVAEVVDRIRHHYPGEVSDEKLERAAIDGLLSTTDPWSQYFTAEEWREWSQRVMSGKFYGVGIRVEADPKTGFLRVTSPIENTPAYEAGVLPGDLIIAVDGVAVQNRPQEDVIGRIKGEVGTKVILTLQRGTVPTFDVTLTRAEITIRAVKHRVIEPGIGYIRIEDFTESVPEDVESAYRGMQSQEMTGLVVDLRFNGGGLLKSAIELCDLWLPKDRVVTISEGRRSEYRRTYRTEGEEALPSGVHIVILVNRGTASASEIVAGALRDHGLATLIGARTFGKGLVQSSFDLADGSHLKLTTARWLTPNGEEVGAKDPKAEAGLVPDHLVEMTPDEEAALWKRWAAESVLKGPPLTEPPPRDYALEAGLEVLKAKRDKRPPNVTVRDVPEPKPEPKAE